MAIEPDKHWIDKPDVPGRKSDDPPARPTPTPTPTPDPRPTPTPTPTPKR